MEATGQAWSDLRGDPLPGGSASLQAWWQLPLEPLHELGHHGVRDPGARLFRQVDGPSQFFYGPHVTTTCLALLLQLKRHKHEQHDTHEHRNQGASVLEKNMTCGPQWPQPHESWQGPSTATGSLPIPLNEQCLDAENTVQKGHQSDLSPYLH